MKKGILLTALVGTLLISNVCSGETKVNNDFVSFNNYKDTPTKNKFLADYLVSHNKKSEVTTISVEDSKGRFTAYTVLFELVGKYGGKNSCLKLIANSNTGVTITINDFWPLGFSQNSSEICYTSSRDSTKVICDSTLLNNRKDVYETSRRPGKVFNISYLPNVSSNNFPSYVDVDDLIYGIVKETVNSIGLK
jgi:hypothetical protein